MSSVLDELVDGVEPAADLLSVLRSIRPAILLSLDVGTSGVRAALFDERGNEISAALIRSRHSARHLDLGELEPDAIVHQVIQAIDDLLSTSLHEHARIEHISISCFWHSLLGIDAAQRPTTPLLTWADTRAGEVAEQLREQFAEQAFHARVGCRFHPSYWPAKLRWFQTERPHIFQKTEQWLGFSEYLSLRLFGMSTASVSMASATGLFNQRKCDWDWDLIKALDIPPQSLPVITKEDVRPRLVDEFINRWPALAEARLHTMVGDGAANNIGTGCCTKQSMALMVGTSGAMRVVYSGTPPANLPSGLWCYRVDRKRVVVGGALSDGGGLYEWLTRSLAIADDVSQLEEDISAMDADGHGLTILPFWSGERSTGWSSDARGGIFGLTMKTQSLEIVRATLEAIAYRFASIARQLEPIAPRAKLFATGNALRASRTWSQIMSDVLGRPLYFSGPAESSVRGAALLALEGLGKIGSIEEAAKEAEEVFEPDMVRHLRYQQGIERQEEIYKLLLNKNDR